MDRTPIDGAAFRAYWRRRTKIDCLFADGAITWAEMRIAAAYCDLHDRAVGSQLRTSRLDGVGGGNGYRAGLHPREALISALRRLHDLHDQLDEHDVRLLEMVVVEDMRWCEIGKRLKRHPKTARARAIGAIRLLSRVW